MIRAATLTDAAAISQFVIGVASAHIAPSLTEDGFTHLISSMDLQHTQQRIVDEWLHLVDEADGQIQGVVVVKPPCHLYHLFVATGNQGQGLGSHLFTLADNHVRQTMMRPIETVNSSLNAISFYSQLGFQPDGEMVNQHGVLFQPMTRSTEDTAG